MPAATIEQTRREWAQLDAKATNDDGGQARANASSTASSSVDMAVGSAAPRVGCQSYSLARSRSGERPSPSFSAGAPAPAGAAYPSRARRATATARPGGRSPPPWSADQSTSLARRPSRGPPPHRRSRLWQATAQRSRPWTPRSELRPCTGRGPPAKREQGRRPPGPRLTTGHKISWPARGADAARGD